MEPLKIYVGWDSREDIAYQACRQSIKDTCSVDVDVIPLKQAQLRRKMFYWRDVDKLASTEFTFTRFLVPELMQHQGWALFIDCDFIAIEDIKKLFDQRDERYAVMCAKHDYTPKEGTKMDGKVQHIYPRKNWSSMVLFNCGHPSNKALNAKLVNDPDTTGAYLHRFSWLDDTEIGELSHEWNWLVGWYNEPADGKPKMIHYTEGGPWFEEYKDCEYSLEYYRAERNYLQQEVKNLYNKMTQDRNVPKVSEQLSYADVSKDPIVALSYAMIDPDGKYYGYSEGDAMKIIQNKFAGVKTSKVAAIFNDDINYKKSSDYVFDEYLQSFIYGCGGRLSEFDAEKTTKGPLLMRGVGKATREAVQHCWETGREFYYIDTGYFGNAKSKSKGWHRITKNNLQNLGPIIERPKDRLLKWKFKKFRPGSKILICPPSEKVMMMFDQPTPAEWTQQVIEQLKEFTDRPIEVRLKPNRTQRISNNSIEDALDNDVHCLITYNSIAALEALMFGKPAIALGPNCASVVCNTDLKDVENLHIPDQDEMTNLMAHLSYCQFSREEMMNGYAWEIVNESS
jgi:lipopolysaccharide biosynthesis glycosyltransferase